MGGQALPAHGLVHGLAGPGVVPGPLPLAHVLEAGAVGLVPGVHGGGAHRLEQVAEIRAHQGAVGDRRVRGTEGGGADLPQVLPQGLGGDAGTDDVAQPPLVGAEAQDAVALHQLDGAVALAHRQLHVPRSDVVLQVHERLGVAAAG